jgi:hypothetical protein
MNGCKKIKTNYWVKIIAAISGSVCLVILSKYFFHASFDYLAFIVVNLMMITGIFVSPNEKNEFLVRMLCFTPLIANIHSENEILPLILGLGIFYLALVSSSYKEKEDSLFWYIGLIISISSAFIIIIAQGYSVSEILGIDEIISYLQIGYLNSALLILPLMLTFSVAINPITISNNLDSFTARRIGAVFLYLLLINLPEGLVVIFQENQSLVIIGLALWLMLHISINEKFVTTDAFLVYFLPWIFFCEGLNTSYFYLIIALSYYAYISKQVSVIKFQSVFCFLGIMSIGVIAWLTSLSLFSELILLGVMYSTWNYTRHVSRDRRFVL